MVQHSCSKMTIFPAGLSQVQWLKNRWESWIKSVLSNHKLKIRLDSSSKNLHQNNCAKAAFKSITLINNLINCGCIKFLKTRRSFFGNLFKCFLRNVSNCGYRASKKASYWWVIDSWKQCIRWECCDKHKHINKKTSFCFNKN